MAARKRTDTLIWGIILITIAIIFLLQNFNVNAIDTLARLWPLGIIIWGAVKLYYGIKERQEEEKHKPKQP